MRLLVAVCSATLLIVSVFSQYQDSDYQYSDDQYSDEQYSDDQYLGYQYSGYQYSDYQYLGCYKDQGNRKLRGEYRLFLYMTQQMCLSYCKKKSFRYAGLQNGNSCFCGDEVPNGVDSKPESDCNKNCPGEVGTKCGGFWRNAIYSTGAVPPQHEYVGCYIDEPNRRLKGFYTKLNSMTHRSCIDLCRDMNFKYAGLQYSHHCFCGNEEPNDWDKRYEGECHMKCQGDYTHKCGAAWRNSVYKTLIAWDSTLEYRYSDFKYLGCFLDSGKRRLRGEYRVFSYMTQQMCLSYCKKRNFKYVGLQNGNSCFCGDEIPCDTDRKPESECSSKCPGEVGTKCGRAWRNAVYSTGAVPPKHEYVGCYIDEGNRRLKGFFTLLNFMTLRSCIDYCRDLSFKYAGLQQRHKCFCGNEEPNNWDRKKDDECKMVCPGDYTHMCGAAWRSSVYKTLAGAGDNTVCGKRNDVMLPLMRHGFTAKPGEFPWHVGIYKLNGTYQWVQICGGNLISPNRVVTAAHCVYLNTTKTTVSADLIKVAIGKHYREWTHDEPDVIKSDVKKILIPPRYDGQAVSYAQDIALIELIYSVRTSANVMPVCVDWNREFTVTEGMRGTLPGWGLTENKKPSDVLMYAELPYIEYEHCISEVLPDFRHYITYDKFCAGYKNGTGPGTGDSGGGLTFAYNGVYYVQGITSVGVNGTNSYALFTNVTNIEILDWLHSTLSE